MSLEFHISEVVALIELTVRLRKQFIGAPRQLACVSQELRSLSYILQDVEIDLYENEADGQQKVLLQEIVSGCRNALLDLEKDVGVYSVLQPLSSQDMKYKMRRVWKRLIWDPNDIRDIRDRLVSNTALLSASLDRISSQTIAAAKKGIDRLNHQQDNQERLVILDWLTTLDYASLQSGLMDKRQAGTGHWFLNTPEFSAWLNTEKSTLFCPGIPGAGKTIISAIVIDNLITRFSDDKTIAVANIYCDYRRTQEQQAENLLASLLQQTAQGLPCLPECVSSLYQKHVKKRTRPSLEEISDTLRDYASVEIRAASPDVQKYVESHLLDLPSFVASRPDLQQEIVAGIDGAVDGMFLLAQLHINSLIGKRSPKAMRAAIAKLPSGSDAYDHAYQEAMERIEGQMHDQQKLAKDVLSWITCAKKPLSATELQHALAVEIGEHELDEDNMPQLEDMVSVCAGLVQVDKTSGIIGVVHYTTQEFFERTRRRWFPDADTQHTIICATYLSYTTFTSGFCHTDDSFEERLRCNPFYSYTAQNWGYHARMASRLQQVEDFLTSPNLVEAASQALLASQPWPGCSDYSQKLPQRMTGLHLAAYFGTETAVGILLQRGVDADARDSTGRTPLSWAAARGHELVVQLLLMDNGVDVNSQDDTGKTPLSWAAKNGQQSVVRRLLACKSVIEASSVGLASSNGHSRETANTITTMTGKRKSDAALADKKGQTPLHRASQNGHVEVARALLSYRTPDILVSSEATSENQATNGLEILNICDAILKTPLHYAVLHSQIDCIRLLLGRTPRISADMDSMTALHYTVSNSSEEMALCFKNAKVPIDIGVKRRSLLEAGADIKARRALLNSENAVVDCSTGRHRGLTPLHYASLVGCKKMTKFLLRNGANPNATSEFGETPLHLALKRDLAGATPWLGFSDRWSENTYRVEYILEILREEYPEDDNVAEYHRTISIVEEYRASVLALLLGDDRTDVGARDDEGATALHSVLYGSSTSSDTIKHLVHRGADICARNNRGQTPLHLACFKGDAPAIKILLDHGANVGAADDMGVNCLHYAAKGQPTEGILSLLTAASTSHNGAPPLAMSRDLHRRNALHHLFTGRKYRDAPAVQSLLDLGVKCNELDKDGMSPLAYYLSFLRGAINADEVVQLLLYGGSDAMFKTRTDGLNLAHLHAKSAFKVQANVFRVLARFEVDLQATDDERRSILHHCAIRGSLTKEAMSFLHEEVGLLPTDKDMHGKTAVDYAAAAKQQRRDPGVWDRDRWSRTEDILLGNTQFRERGECAGVGAKLGRAVLGA
ncbi:hypothetical protein PWT90_09714 [Aphanocladium album]|nr:hypothetical protein PWT90_09714 [Aphanocladium album]